MSPTVNVVPPPSVKVLVNSAGNSKVIIRTPGPQGPPGFGVEDHAVVTQNVHGISDTALLVYDADLDAHAAAELAARNAAIATEAAARAQAIADTLAALASHEADTTAIHGIADTGELILEGDPRLTDTREPDGPAGGDLTGTYPNPTLAVARATQADFEAEVGAREAADAAEATARTNAIAAEATARSDADALLIPLTQKGANNGVATLGSDGKLVTGQLSATVINDTFVVNTQAAMLALTAQRGDMAVRSDLSKTFVLAGDDPTVLANWQELLSPAGGVSSVDGRSGAVTLGDLYANKASETDQRVPTDGSVTNAKVAAGAGIEKSKLAALAIVDSDISAGAAIAKAKLAALNIGNADIAASAAIAKSKLAALNIVNSDVDANAAIAKTKLAPLNIENADVASNAAIAKTKLASLEIVNADISAGAAIAKAKLAALNIANADVAAGAGIEKSKLASLNIVNADVASSAAIAESKLALDVPTATAIPKTLVDAKGDLLVATAADTLERKAAGSNDSALLSDSTQNDGLRWGEVAQPLYRATSLVTIANTTADTVLDSFTVPAGKLGILRGIHFRIFCDYLNNSGATRTLTIIIRFGGLVLYEDTSPALAVSSVLRAINIDLWGAPQNNTTSFEMGGQISIGGIGAAVTGVGDLATTDIINAPIEGLVSTDTNAAQVFEVSVIHSVANANLYIRRRMSIATLI